VALEQGNCGTYINYPWKVVKCGAGGWWRPLGPVIREMKCYEKLNSTGISNIK